MTIISAEVRCSFCSTIHIVTVVSEPKLVGVSHFICGDPVFTTDVATKATSTNHICFSCVDTINKLRGE